MPKVTPEEVLKYTAPTDEFLCSFAANTYGIDFLSFKIRDMATNEEIFNVNKDPDAPTPEYPPNFDYDQLRSINYRFNSKFLKFQDVGTTLRFKVGPKAAKNFRMIERHYFQGKLIKSYDFNFDFCIPNSTNEWESIYDMPPLSAKEVQAFVDAKGDKRQASDSFYFVDGEMVMHNKAFYTYFDEEVEGKTEKKQ